MTRADAVSQPVLISIRTGSIPNFISRTGTVYNGKTACLFTLCNIFLDRLTADIHTNGENFRSRIFDRGCFLSGTNGRFITVAGTVQAFLIKNVIVKSSGGVIGIVSGIAAGNIGRGKTITQKDDILIFILNAIQHIRCHGQTGFNIGETTMIVFISSHIDDGSGLSTHSIFQGSGLL